MLLCNYATTTSTITATAIIRIITATVRASLRLSQSMWLQEAPSMEESSERAGCISDFVPNISCINTFSLPMCIVGSEESVCRPSVCVCVCVEGGGGRVGGWESRTKIYLK